MRGLTRDAAKAEAFKLAAEKLAEENERLRSRIARILHQSKKSFKDADVAELASRILVIDGIAEGRFEVLADASEEGES